MNFTGILTSLGLNSVPAIGWFVADWSPGTTLAVYWYENLAMAVTLACQVLVHRRYNRLRGHFAYKAPENDQTGARTYLGSYFPRALVFIFGHAIFLAVLLLLFFPQKFGPEASVQPASFVVGVVTETLLALASFLMSLPHLRSSPFRWLEEAGTRSMGRIILVQLVIMGGMFWAAITNSPRGMFGLFIVLKTMADLAAFLPQYQPKEAPGWLCRMMDKIGTKKHPQDTFAEYWKETDKAEQARQARNEEPFTG